MSDALQSPIRLLIVDDHPVIRAGLTSMLATQPNLDVIETASNGEEALSVMNRTRIDVVLLDLRMPGMSGVETLGAMKKLESKARAIILTSFERDEDIYKAMQAGAQGYLLKDSSLKQMIEAIETVAQGKHYIRGEIASRLAERLLRADLTPREIEILRMVAKGLTNKEIGIALTISNHTVKNHVNRIIEKLDVSDRTEAATSALQRGLITSEE
jgi:DNA-binding NarL/FixJ family response regulator